MLTIRCDTITGRTSCLVLNTKATEIENIEDTFHLVFDDNIMNKLAYHTNNRINDPTDTLRLIDVDSMSILRWYVEK